MKLKEKLANEAAVSDASDHGDEHLLFHIGFISGFEKARTIICEDLKERKQALARLGMVQASISMEAAEEDSSYLGEDEV